MSRIHVRLVAPLVAVLAVALFAAPAIAHASEVLASVGAAVQAALG
jgi:hypothetical protein